MIEDWSVVKQGIAYLSLGRAKLKMSTFRPSHEHLIELESQVVNNYNLQQETDNLRLKIRIEQLRLDLRFDNGFEATTPDSVVWDFMVDAGLLRQPVDWEREFECKILDPDGWRLIDKDFDDYVTREEFVALFTPSTAQHSELITAECRALDLLTYKAYHHQNGGILWNT